LKKAFYQQFLTVNLNLKLKIYLQSAFGVESNTNLKWPKTLRGQLISWSKQVFYLRMFEQLIFSNRTHFKNWPSKSKTPMIYV
jgi:hypothetical protein